MTHAPAPTPFLDAARPEVRGLPASGIVEVFDYGRDRPGLIPLWVGEGDRPTPAFICEAAAAALRAGETFYTHQAGLPELRAALAAYMERHYGRPFPGGRFGPERFSVTVGGMHALQIAARVAAGAGDEVLVPTPAWPNFAGALAAAGATPVACPMHLAEGPDGARWRVAVADLERACTPRTRALVVNSPSNPTGWTATAEEVAALLDFARARGLWIIADEIYGRFTHDGGARAPSFHDAMRADDRVMFVQTFSKNWAMTGWRIGWLEAPPELGPAIGSLIQYSTSGVPVSAQRAALAALAEGEALVAEQVALARSNRGLVVDALRSTGRMRGAPPEGAFYLFCGFDGAPDSRALALRLVDEAGVGVAPGSAFGPGGEGSVRLCFLRRADEVAEAARRVAAWLGG